MNLMPESLCKIRVTDWDKFNEHYAPEEQSNLDCNAALILALPEEILPVANPNFLHFWMKHFSS